MKYSGCKSVFIGLAVIFMMINGHMSLQKKVLLITLGPLLLGILCTFIMSNYFKVELITIVEEQSALIKSGISKRLIKQDLEKIKEFGSKQLGNIVFVEKIANGDKDEVKKIMDSARMMYPDDIVFWLITDKNNNQVSISLNQSTGIQPSTLNFYVSGKQTSCLLQLIQSESDGQCFTSIDGKAYYLLYEPIYNTKGDRVGGNYLGYSFDRAFARVKKLMEYDVAFVQNGQILGASSSLFTEMKINTNIESNFQYEEKVSEKGAYQFNFSKIHEEKEGISGYYVFVEDIQGKNILKRKQYLYTVIILLLVILMGGVAAFKISKSISDPIKNIAQDLLANQNDLSKISDELTASSGELSSTSTEQASATQESVAAMEEMKSMLGHTHQYAQSSQQTAGEVSLKAQEGNSIMEELSNSMIGIEQANQDMTNMRFIIEQIGKKTDIINEIVFKTQLLSFNASIEAARAGQHGKGFSVVAEEVGNLAKMSGESAQEIAALLNNSSKEVNKVIESTKKSVESGIRTTQAALNIFLQIKQNVVLVDEQVISITRATNEQQEGIVQTSMALAQLGDAASNNNRLALKTLGNVDHLKEIRNKIESNIFKMASLIGNTKSGHREQVANENKILAKPKLESLIIPDEMKDADYKDNFEKL